MSCRVVFYFSCFNYIMLFSFVVCFYVYLFIVFFYYHAFLFSFFLFIIVLFVVFCLSFLLLSLYFICHFFIYPFLYIYWAQGPFFLPKFWLEMAQGKAQASCQARPRPAGLLLPSRVRPASQPGPLISSPAGAPCLLSSLVA